MDLSLSRFTDAEYRALLDWYMVSDPWQLEADKSDKMREMLTTEARTRGYDDWVQAYHNFEAGQ